MIQYCQSPTLAEVQLHREILGFPPDPMPWFPEFPPKPPKGSKLGVGAAGAGVDLNQNWDGPGMASFLSGSCAWNHRNLGEIIQAWRQNHMFPCHRGKLKKKLRWYPQQPQRFISINIFSATFSGTFSATFSGTAWTWPCPAPKIPKTFSGIFSATFSGTLLNLTWLCTKASQTFSGTFSGTFSRTPVSLALHQSLPDLLRNLLRNPVEPNLALHQSLPDLLRNLQNPVEPRPFPEPSEPSPEPSPEPLLNLTWLCTKASQTFSGTFGTFSGTSLSLTRRLHQCTPELFWAEDPISLRCWGMMMHKK